MKKITNISLLLLIGLSSVLTACSPSEEKDIFDKSAALRLEETITNYKSILADKGGKWAMQYYTTTDESGYMYLMTFNKNGSVTISGENKYITKLTNVDSNTPTYGSETSLWDVIGDNGPVLTFNTYNTYFHLFADPEDIPDTETNEQGYGHNGDYEFDLMKYSGDTIYLQGKKHGANIIMTRVASDVNDQTYLGEVTALTDSFFNAKIPAVYVNLPGSYRHVMINGATLIPSFYPETGDRITESVGPYSMIITHDGLNFQNAITLTDSIDGKKYTFQHFIRQADGSLLCTDGNGITITADHLNRVFTNQTLVWRVDNKTYSGNFATLYDAINSELKKNFSNSTINYLQFSYNKTTDSYLFTYNIKRRNGTLTCTLNYTVSLSGDDVVNLSFDGTGDKNALTVLSKSSSLQTLINEISKGLKVSASSVLAPVRIKLTSTSNDADYFYADIQ